MKQEMETRPLEGKLYKGTPAMPHYTNTCGEIT